MKICRWTKSQLRGRGGCYKHSFYGIESHRWNLHLFWLQQCFAALVNWMAPLCNYSCYWSQFVNVVFIVFCEHIWCCVVGSLDCCFLFITSYDHLADAWKQLQVWLVQINVYFVGDITQILLERAGNGRWMTLLTLWMLQLTSILRWLSKWRAYQVRAFSYIWIYESWVIAWAIHYISYCPSQIISPGRLDHDRSKYL